MQYRTNTEGLALGRLEKEAIDAKLGLSLGRFNNLISDFEIGFTQDKHSKSNIYTCLMHVVLKNDIDFIVSDFGNTKVEAFRSALDRIKRNIERHLKRQCMVRVSNYLSARIN